MPDREDYPNEEVEQLLAALSPPLPQRPLASEETPECPEEALLYENLLWEHSMSTQGYQKVWDAEDPEGDTRHSTVAFRLRSKLWPAMVLAVGGWFRDHVGSTAPGGPHKTILLPFIACGPEQVSATLLTSFLQMPVASALSKGGRLVRGSTRQRLMSTLGRSMVASAGIARALEEPGMTAARLDRLMVRRDKRSRARYRELVGKFRQEHYEDWASNAVLIRVGAEGLAILFTALPDYLEEVLEWGPKHTQYAVVRHTPAYWHVWNKLRDRAAFLSPTALPMIAPPKPWLTADDPDEPTRGGYRAIYKPLIRGVSTQREGEFSISPDTLRALEIAQSVPYRINRAVLRVLTEAVRRGDTLEGLVPPRPGDGASPEALSRYDLHERILGAASRMAGRDAFWFPANFDWRLRMYPLPLGLTPQGDDLAKGLLEFVRPVERTNAGDFWRMVNLANTADVGGISKAPFTDRWTWADASHDLIEATARDPLGDRRWTAVDAPWQFLAACCDFMDGRSVSRLPMALDGSCSGMQHYSLLTRDPVGAKATNCTPSEVPQDLYREVAGRVMGRLEKAAAEGDPQALLWYPLFQKPGEGRKVVKRAVMTVPYGVTTPGITRFLLGDGHADKIIPREKGEPPEAGEQRFKAAAYLTGIIRAAVGDVMAHAAKLQAYYNAVAYQLARAEKPLRWRTPAGSVVSQAYKTLATRRIAVPGGAVTIIDTTIDTMYDPRRALSATSPNVIHSYDAAHLQMALCMMHRLDVKDVMTVHDSFSTHPEKVGRMGLILRSAACSIYSRNQPAEWAASVAELSGIDTPAPPELGTLDPRSILEAKYMFA